MFQRRTSDGRLTQRRWQGSRQSIPTIPTTSQIRDNLDSVNLDVEDGPGAVAKVEDSSSPRETSHISSGSSSCSDVLGSDRHVLQNDRHLFREACKVNPVGKARVAYPHKSLVEYYSCTNHKWLRGVLTLDTLDRCVDGSQHVDEVVYGVHLTRTQQFRNHVALYHLRKPLAIGHMVEVLTNPPTTWKPATIRKITLGKLERFLILDLDGKQAIVPVSSVRRCFPVKSQVFRDMCRISSGFTDVSTAPSRSSTQTKRSDNEEE